MPEPLNVVIDISHHDGNVNLAKAKEDGILGVIQKATQGQTFKDPTAPNSVHKNCPYSNPKDLAEQEKEHFGLGNSLNQNCCPHSTFRG